jgi:hypothetical protein
MRQKKGKESSIRLKPGSQLKSECLAAAKRNLMSVVGSFSELGTRNADVQHERATAAAPRRPRHCPVGLGLRQSEKGGVLLAREQRRLAAIATADVVGYSHAADGEIYYSSRMPRTYLCARPPETLD